MTLDVRTIRTEGLGDSTYLVSHDGICAIVDPQRDIDRFLTEIDALNVEPRWVLETHVHNDYVSGARDLARSVGAELIMPAGAAPAYRHTAAYHNESLFDRGLEIRPIHTPGHTPEHMSYLIQAEDKSLVFSGGSLLVGSAGRSDLLGAERADTLARLQYQSVNRLARLSDDTGLYPTHGAGSFCTASAAGATTSTIGAERRSNPALRHDDEETFVASHLSGLVPYPSYYQYMAPANIVGLPPARSSSPPTLSEEELRSLDDVVVVDARPRREFASGHLPGSLGIELRRDFGVWVGWIAPFDSRLVIVLNTEQDVGEAQRQLSRIGFDRVVGVITNLTEWETQLATHQVVDAEGFAAMMSDSAQVLDVRAPEEWREGTVPGSTTCYVPDLATTIPSNLSVDRPVLIACRSGHRASIAASLMQQRGFSPVVLIGAGVPEVLSLT